VSFFSWLCVADQRQPDAGVAGRALDDHPAGAQLAGLFGVADDAPGGAILDRAARVEELGLGEDGAAGLGARLVQLDQRRAADGADEAVANIHCA
jgi:hypothetical protein